VSEQKSNMPNKILVVDDDPSVPVSIEQAFKKFNIQVLKASDLASALYLFNQHKFEVVIVELDFGPLPGLALVQKWRLHEMEEKRNTGFIMLGAGTQRSAGDEALLRELGDLEIMNKPVNPVQLLPMISRALGTKTRNTTLLEAKSRLVDPHLKTKQYDKAIENVQKLIPEGGDKAKRLLLEVYEAAEKYKDCFDSAVMMLKVENNNINLISTAGRMCMKLGNFTEARPFLEKADALAPQNLERLNQLATMYLKANQPEKSVAVFKKLNTLNPENPEYKFEVFKLLYEAGFGDHAVNFGKEVAQPMEIVRHYNNKGVLLAKEGRQDEALKEYDRSLKFFPKFKENSRIYFNIALAHLSRKTKEDYVKADGFLTKALELDPNFDKAKQAQANLKKILAGFDPPSEPSSDATSEKKD
jgi:tetratricopeptide (TPR) repeat protein